MRYLASSLLTAAALACTAAQARVITVTTVNNVNPPAGQTSLLQALSSLQDGDEVRFNISGAGPHYIQTPSGGYPLITKNNITIDGYSQPGALPNTNPILAANNAQIKIVLDSRNGNSRVLDFAPTQPNDDTGYGDGESCILGVLEAEGLVVQGLALLGVPTTGDGEVSLYGVSFAKGAAGRVSGCWIGIDPDGETIAGPVDGITGFRYRVRDDNNQVTETILIDGVTVGVAPQAANAPAQFNVITGIPAIPIIIEGNATRIAGNFIGVFPDGLRDYNPALDPEVPYGTFEGAIEIGRAGNDTLIGTDGDGVNDANERNVIGGTMPPDLGGYDHTIEFYGQTPGTNIVVAGNYVGVAVDGHTAFTNGVPVLNATGGSAQYRFGSNFDGVSDDLEGNVVYNNLPLEVFPAWNFGSMPANLNFFDELSNTGTLSARGNTMVNNFPFPVSPLKDGGAFLVTYYDRALADAAAGVVPTLAPTTTLNRLIGTVPLTKTAEWPVTIVDVYAADPLGISNGKDAQIPELPNGFVQGKYYLASFIENGPLDLNQTPGAFEFDISKVDLKGTNLTVTANYVKAPGDAAAWVLTSPFADPVEVVFTPGSVESVGLRHILKDTLVINPELKALGNWEPYASVLGTSTFLIEANTFAQDSTEEQRYVVALQPADGKAGRLGEGFYTDAGQPFKAKINFSRQNGNPGRVAGDRRPGAVNFMVGGEASPHLLTEFGADNRWTLGFDRFADGRYAVVQGYSLDAATLAQTPVSQAIDAINGRLTEGAPVDSQIGRFGGDIACLDNGNFVVVVHDRSRVRNPEGDATVAVILAPNGAVVKDSFVVENRDTWSNLASYKGGFCVRVHENLHFFDNAGNLQGTINQSTSGEAFNNDRGDGTRIAGHINSPYVFLAGKVTTESMVRVAVWDARDRTFVAKADVSEGAFAGDFNRATLAVDALNRVLVSWVSKPTGYEKDQVAVRVMAFDAGARKITALTKSFLPFVNTAQTGGIRSYQMSVAMTTRQLLVAAKGEVNLQNKPELGADSPEEVNFYAIISHPAPVDDPTPPVGGGGEGPALTVAVSGDNVVLSWPQSETGYTVEAKNSLSDATWSTVGTQNPTTVPIAPGTRFFRLRK